MPALVPVSERGAYRERVDRMLCCSRLMAHICACVLESVFVRGRESVINRLSSWSAEKAHSTEKARSTVSRQRTVIQISPSLTLPGLCVLPRLSRRASEVSA
jgi:hypothetical protein